MSLTRRQAKEAAEYNAKPKNWAGSENLSETFALATAFFQSEIGLEVDGKMGPRTVAHVKEWAKEKDMTEREIPIGKEFSNCIIFDGESISLPQEMTESGITCSNYMHDGEPHFKRKKRTAKLQHFVLHETAGNTAKGCKRTLLKKGYGVQLILDPCGHVSCHGDLLRDRMAHGNQLNNTSIGIEVVNPYTPLYAKEPFKQFISAQWWTWVPSSKDPNVKKILKRRGMKKVPRSYVLPTEKQMRVIKLLVPWVCEVTGIPYEFPTAGLSAKKRRIDGWNKKPRAKPGPGVVAHKDYASHADGRYILEGLIRAEDSK